MRREALEKLWDSWKRLKTIDAGKDKKETTKALLDKISSEPKFRELIEEEAKLLTRVGNQFMIRHTEKGKVPIVSSDSNRLPLFGRLFFMLVLLALKSSDRAS